MRDKRHIDLDIVDMISKSIDVDAEPGASSLKFVDLFKGKVGSHHMIPCRVCHTFVRAWVMHIDSTSKHDAVILCPRHYLQFKSYYLAALPEIDRPVMMYNLAVYDYAEDVVRALIGDDGYPFSCDRIQYNEGDYPIVADLSRCDFFLDYHRRDALRSRIKKKRAKEVDREDIVRLGDESARVYGLEMLPFPGPWEEINWWEPK